MPGRDDGVLYCRNSAIDYLFAGRDWLMGNKRAKRASPKAVLPSRGDAFLMPLPDGRYGVCRVIRRSTPQEEKILGEGYVLVAASSWIGKTTPDVAEPRLREILLLNHHAWKNKPEVNWVSDPIPDSYRRFGAVEPSLNEERMECFSLSGWESFPLQVHRQWQWDNERDAVIREDDRQKESEAREREESGKRHQEYLGTLTLEGLKKKRRFSEWKGYVPVKLGAACRKVFKETIDGIIELGPHPKKRAVLTILRRCIETLNELDEQHKFISTIEREDLCEEFDEIVHACGFRGEEELADRWREW
jgi:hypothetical protein